jgi:PIN domain nuclease of toxin-antitoxin system
MAMTAILLDSHTFLWWCDGDRKLSTRVRRIMEDGEADIYFSAASAWEIATKARIGKLPQAMAVARNLPAIVEEQGLKLLPVTVAHAHRAGWLDVKHRDPFDRMLAAQSMIEKMPIATRDREMRRLGATVIW